MFLLLILWVCVPSLPPCQVIRASRSPPPNHTHPHTNAQVIWGTTYPILTFVKRFRRFVRNFTLPRPANANAGAGDDEEEEGQQQEPHYIALLKEMRRTRVGGFCGCCMVVGGGWSDRCIYLLTALSLLSLSLCSLHPRTLTTHDGHTSHITCTGVLHQPQLPAPLELLARAPALPRHHALPPGDGLLHGQGTYALSCGDMHVCRYGYMDI